MFQIDTCKARNWVHCKTSDGHDLISWELTVHVPPNQKRVRWGDTNVPREDFQEVAGLGFVQKHIGLLHAEFPIINSCPYFLILWVHNRNRKTIKQSLNSMEKSLMLSGMLHLLFMRKSLTLEVTMLWYILGIINFVAKSSPNQLSSQQEVNSPFPIIQWVFSLTRMKQSLKRLHKEYLVWWIIVRLFVNTLEPSKLDKPN